MGLNSHQLSPYYNKRTDWLIVLVPLPVSSPHLQSALVSVVDFWQVNTRWEAKWFFWSSLLITTLESIFLWLQQFSVPIRNKIFVNIVMYLEINKQFMIILIGSFS